MDVSGDRGGVSSRVCVPHGLGPSQAEPAGRRWKLSRVPRASDRWLRSSRVQGSPPPRCLATGAAAWWALNGAGAYPGDPGTFRAVSPHLGYEPSGTEAGPA